MQKSAQNSEKDKLACFLKRLTMSRTVAINQIQSIGNFHMKEKYINGNFFLTSQRMADEHNSLVHILLLIL